MEVAYQVTPREGGAVVHLTSASREELFRDAIAATLELVYGATPSSQPGEGQVVPVQAAGADDAELLQGLLSGCLEESEVSGRLLPPRWMSFDDERVTATLPRTEGHDPARRMGLKGVQPGARPFEATLTFEVRH